MSTNRHISPRLTRINGKGLWNSWTRNFKTPLLACLDLIDNSFDAGNPILPPSPVASSETQTEKTSFRGKIHIEAERATSILNRSGLVIRNNSSKAIKSLENVLEVYSSSKGGDESIGENGVGLKQGCATLSDLSFVLLKNKNKLQFGVIAAYLQLPEGVRLPSFELNYDDDEDGDYDILAAEIKDICKIDKGVRNCFIEWGEGSYDLGVERLQKHFHVLLSKDWGDHAFCVILTDLRHDRCGQHQQAQSLSIAKRGKDKAMALMDELRDNLQKYYLHIPEDFEFLVNKEIISFCHWQKRLVELSYFSVRIDPTNPWTGYDKDNDSKWKYPVEGYPLRIYLGFDPLRFHDEEAISACSLFVYSRHCGRLIKHTGDARAELNITSGGSEYSQGLTVIVDDINGKLPLNPTKQDIAFGEEQNGQTHKMNLFSWVTACAYLYWNHHCTKFDGKKKILGLTVLESLDVIRRNTSMSTSPLGDLDLTEFLEVPWAKYYGNRIRVRGLKSKPYVVRKGIDTKFSIDYNSAAMQAEGYMETKKRRISQSPTRTDANHLHGIANRECSILDMPMINMNIPLSTQQKDHCKHCSTRCHLELRVKELEKEIDSSLKNVCKQCSTRCNLEMKIQELEKALEKETSEKNEAILGQTKLIATLRAYDSRVKEEKNIYLNQYKTLAHEQNNYNEKLCVNQTNTLTDENNKGEEEPKSSVKVETEAVDRSSFFV